MFITEVTSTILLNLCGCLTMLAITAFLFACAVKILKDD